MTFFGKRFLMDPIMRQIHARLFGAAAILQILVGIGHVTGHFAMPRPANDTERQLIEMMSSYEKDVAGGKMSILESYDGLNLCYALFFLLVGVLNLTLKKNSGILIRPASLINAMAMGSGAIISLIYFFWIPVLYFGLTGIFFTLVHFYSRNGNN
jgi:hypothetical protein